MASRTRSKGSRRAPENRRKTGAKRPPGNRRKTGGKLLFGKGIDPAVGKATQFRPGESGNSSGRPTKTPLTDELLELLKAVDRRGVTLAHRIAEIICKEALKGDVRFVNLLFERAEGPAVQVHRIGGDEDAPPINLNVTDARERFNAIVERIRSRARQAQTETQDNTGGIQ